MFWCPLLCQIQRRKARHEDHCMFRGHGPKSTQRGCLKCPPRSSFPLKEGTAGEERPQAKVTMLGGGNGSREVSDYTKANNIRSNPNVSFPWKENLANISAPQVIQVNAFISGPARTETTLSLSSYLRHTQALMPKTCPKPKKWGSLNTLTVLCSHVETTVAGGGKTWFSGYFAQTMGNLRRY